MEQNIAFTLEVIQNGKKINSLSGTGETAWHNLATLQMRVITKSDKAKIHKKYNSDGSIEMIGTCSFRIGDTETKYIYHFQGKEVDDLAYFL